MQETVVVRSEALVLSEREAGKMTGRLVDEKNEFWVRLGKAVEPFIGPD